MATENQHKIFVLEIWKGDFKNVYLYSTIEAAKAAYKAIMKTAKKEGEYISDATLCEHVLDGVQYIQKGYSLL